MSHGSWGNSRGLRRICLILPSLLIDSSQKTKRVDELAVDQRERGAWCVSIPTMVPWVRECGRVSSRLLPELAMRISHRSILVWTLLTAAGVSVTAQVFVPVDTPAEILPSGNFLITRQVNLTPGLAEGPPARARFEMGFSTSESAGPGLHDSVTATLTTLGDTPVAVLATIDLTGITLAPTSPGALTVNAAGITLAPVASRFAVVSGDTFSVAYSIDLPVPAGLDGSNLKLVVDFVDVGDPGGSKAWFFVRSAVAVPEAKSWWLLGTLPAWACWRRRSHR